MTDQTTDTTVQPVAAAAPQLQLQDLMLAAQVIQLSSQRGAIRPDEFTAVGGLYDRILAFLQASGALQPADVNQPATPPAGSPAQ